MVAIEIDNVITQFSKIPSTWNGVLNYNSVNNTEQQVSDGWKDVVIPSYNTDTQKLGGLILDEPYYTYEVIDLTNEEIQSRLTSQAESDQQEAITQALATDVVNTAQQADDTNSLDNQALFPMWKFPFDYTVDYKCQSFTSSNELVLYKCVQAHTSQSDWNPNVVPALFTRVAYPNEILVWVQPTGAQDAYNIGDQVYFPTENDSVYESLIDANTWSPTAYPAGWQLIP